MLISVKKIYESNALTGNATYELLQWWPKIMKGWNGLIKLNLFQQDIFQGSQNTLMLSFTTVFHNHS